MMNLFAATGHVHYTKSARLYLQLMYRLNEDYPWIHQQYTKNGYHCVRRTSKARSGLWSDLIIEKTMMSSIKSREAVTCGRGM